MEKEAKKLYKSTKQKLSKAKRSYVCRSLKDVVRGYRNCKTASEERDFVKKESAHIRDLFREEDTTFRRQNVLKLLFFHMNGYPTEWGQLECLKLCASARFKDKRVGYLGLMILLDENQQILMMMTNCLKLDMNHNDTKIAALALTAMGNISTPEMIRDLLPEVLKLMQNGTPHLRKKAALIGARAVRKLPELSADLIQPIRRLLSARHGSVLLTSTTLLIEICKYSPDLIPEMRTDLLPLLRDLLSDLLAAGFDPDLTVGGVTDPFMQVKVLQAIGTLAKRDQPASDSVEDVLSQVLSSTDANRNAGAAVIAECVKTIFKIESPQSLQALAMSNLGKFLISKDPNSRFLALSELRNVVKLNPALVKPYTETILECLHERDTSIRHRAVELAFAVADQNTLSRVTEEVLEYIEDCNPDVKEETCTHLVDMVDRLSSNLQWKVEIFIRLLKKADDYVREDLLDLFAALISSTSSVQGYAAERLFNEVLATKADAPIVASTFKLDRFAFSIFGEYGELVTSHSTGIRIDDVYRAYDAALSETMESVATEELDRATYEALLATRQVAITSAAKLFSKVVEAGQVGEENILQVRQLISKWRQSLDLESQQRACELSTLLTVELSEARSAIFARQETIDADDARKRILLPLTGTSSSLALLGGSSDLIGFGDDLAQLPAAEGSNAPAAQRSDPLSDILGLSSLPAPPKAEPLPLPGIESLTMPPPSRKSGPSAQVAGGSLLDDLLGPSAPRPASVEAARRPATTSSAASSVAKPEGTELGPLPVMDENGLQVSISLFKVGTTPQNETRAVARFLNTSQQKIERFVFLLSVPKYMKLHLQPATSTSLEANGGSATQSIGLQNAMSGEKSIQLRFRVEYTKAGQPTMQKQGVIANIPRDL
ncbi:hypothetical protein NDN08_007043 [Rhodosorus marinus]|uniref:AP-1 complex subunit gamma n=1 Tax=Rhodosorus marinus TaxID=101924 RepID=A0AAV8UGW1_9RHOD|nr:hypothetical protein NDN08_007043 [Rhodosorus marinus]